MDTVAVGIGEDGEPADEIVHQKFGEWGDDGRPALRVGVVPRLKLMRQGQEPTEAVGEFEPAVIGIVVEGDFGGDVLGGQQLAEGSTGRVARDVWEEAEEADVDPVHFDARNIFLAWCCAAPATTRRHSPKT